MQTTSATWKQLAALGGVRVESKAIINSVEYTGESLSPPIITRALMQNGVTIGNVVSAVCTFSLITTNVIPKSAEVQIKMRLTDNAETSPTTSEWLPCGTFYVSRRKRDPISGEVAFECYDALLKAGAVWEPASDTWPKSMTSIVSEFLTLLGLQLDSRTTIDANYTLSGVNAGATIRDVLGIIAQYHGANWIVTPENKLRMVPIVDAAGAEEAEEDVIDVDAVIGELQAMPSETITGIRCTYDDVTAIVGTETGIVVDAAIPATVAVELAETLVGMTYQPYLLSVAYYDLAVELGDFVRYSDDVSSVLYAENVTVGPAMSGNISAPDYAEIIDEYPYIGNSEKALTIAKAYVDEVSESFDESLTQEEIFNRLTDNGAAQGMVLADGQLYINASYINAGKIRADFVEFNNYDTDILIPNEFDESSLFDGQSVQDGWIISNSNYITILKIPNAAAHAGQSVEFAFVYDSFTGGYNSYYDTDPEGSELIPEPIEYGWPPVPTAGATDSTGALSGPTQVGSYNQYGRKFTIPSDAVADFEIHVRTNSGIKDIKANFTVDSNLEFRYGNNVGLSYKGIQSGKFVVDRTGNATFGGDVTFVNASAVLSELGAKAIQTAVSDPTASGTSTTFIDSISQDAQGVITPTKKTVASASQSADGLMSSTDKTKLDGIASGAQVNSITGVKGDAEADYRTGNVNLTAANIGAVDADDIANDLTTTAAGKVLDARQGKALNDLISAQIPSQIFTVKASGSKALTLAANTRCLIFGNNNVSTYFAVLVYCDASGNVGYAPMMTANNITITGGSGYTLTIANSSARSVYCGALVLNGSVTA